ncbi:MAG: HAMP domain-containing histidine kinase [Clostridia bacterium]|nr:HAMP domain-containing histidine kinase [Clostridia bacterium]
MKNGQLRSESDRTVALILLVCMTIIAAGCFMGIVYLQEYNFYKQDNKGQTAKSVAVQLYSIDDAELAKDYYLCRIGEESEYRIDYYETRFSRENTNFAFTINNVLGEVLFDSLNPNGEENTPLTFERAKNSSEYTGKSDFYFFDEDGAFITLKLEYAILAPELQVTNDRYSSAFDWIDIAYSLRYFVFVVLFVALAIIVVLLSLFTINAGTVDEETGEIVPGFIDKLPLDFVTVFVVLLFFAAGTVLGLTTAADTGMVLNNVILMIVSVAAILVVMSYLTTFSVRVKMGKFYKNTIVYKIYHKFKRKTPRKIRRAVGEMTLFRKIVIGIVSYILFEGAILISMAYFGIINKDVADTDFVLAVFLVAWTVTRLIIIPIVVMIAINLNYVKEEGRRLAEGVMGDEIADKLSVAAIRTHGQNLDRIKKEINKAMEQELKSEKLKSELITNVSHDIKTPLTSIKNYVDFLNNDNLTDEERKNYIAIIAKHTDKLSMLLNDLIEASKIQSGSIEIELEKTSLNITMEQTIEEFAVKLENSRLIPRISIPEEDVFIMGDGKWLWRIFANLINNACKYAAPETDLEISIDRIGDKARIRISNECDTEFGFEGSELFERFVRGDSSRHTEGHGLGLSIAKSLVEMQGGTMDISVAGNRFAAILDFNIAE